MRIPVVCVLLAVFVLRLAAGQDPVRPRLAVVISVDQMRGDYLARFAPFFGSGGFRRFRDGRWYTQCFYKHGITKTGPGHAVMLTGVHANVHGIIANEWKRRNWPNLEEVNCVEDRASPLVGLPPRAWRSPGGVLEAKAGRSPAHLVVPTLGDALKARFGAGAKVFGIADKDRAAILMSGRRADGAYWTEEGRVVTSTYYRAQLPAYLETFNAEERAARVFGATWDRLLEPAVYESTQGPDDAAGEASAFGLGRTFPKRLDGGRAEVTKDFHEAFDHSPWNNELVADLARAVLVHEELGKDDGAPDLLAIGFSQTDKIGHGYGPDSHEVMDSFVRLDRTLAALFAFIDEKVGLEHCIVVLTSDHGIPPLPERRIAAGLPAGRVAVAELDRHVTAALNARFGTLPTDIPWAMRDGLTFHLNPAALAAKCLSGETLGAALAEALRTHALIGAAYTRADFLSPQPLDPAGEAQRLSFHGSRSGEVVAVLKPYCIDRGATGTSHGQPHEYDQHVPLAWFGRGVSAARIDERVGVDDLAPTLGGLLGVRPPVPGTKDRPLF